MVKISGTRRDFLKKMAVMPLINTGENIYSFDSNEVLTEAGKFKKIDIHMHISSDAGYLREVMDEMNIKMFVMTNKALQLDRLKLQVDVGIEISRKYPRYYSWCTTFGFERMFEPDWIESVKKYLKYGFENGALAVKVWKEVGMQVKDNKGDFLQIDNSIFDPVFDYIRREGKTLFTHIGDPVDCWLSTDPDGKQNFWYTEGADITRNRIGKFQGEVSYDKLMIARDRMLSKHPDLKVIGCHLGSMAFDLDEVAERLDKYPNFAVDTSLTIPYLMGQAREKVRVFFIKYQDRILYGLDESGGMVPTQYLKDMSKVGQQWTLDEVQIEKKKLLRRYTNDFTYFFTDKEIKNKNYTIKGLALPEEVLQKIFYSNAVKWVPGIDKGF